MSDIRSNTFSPESIFIIWNNSSGLLTYVVSFGSPSPEQKSRWIMIRFATFTVAGTVVDFHNFPCCLCFLRKNYGIIEIIPTTNLSY